MFKKKEQTIISETTPFVVGKLSVYPNRLKYKDRKCNFNDIESLSWYWLSQTINGLNTQNVKFSIYIIGDSRPIKINKTTMYVTPKLVTAYNFIAKKTFQTRLKKYTDQLEEHGGFRYQNVTIYSDGRVVKGDKTFLLQNAQYEPFKITIKQGGLFSSRCSIDTTVDKDVVLGLIDYILKNPQDTESIRENAKRRKEAEEAAGSFLPNLICMLAKMSKADGVVTTEEIDVIKGFFYNDLKLDDKSFGIAVSIFNDAKDSPEPIELHARNVLNEIGEDTGLLISIVNLLFSIAVSDEHFSAEEELMINAVETIFGVTGKTNYSSFQREQQQKTENESNGDDRSFEILGLDIGADPSEIKITYRRLVMQYHPDRVQHLGPEFQALAEEKIKEINMAYEYFQNKYSI